MGGPESKASVGFDEETRQTAQVNGGNAFDVQITRDTLGRIAQPIEAVDAITRVFGWRRLFDGRHR